jgi:hypothetical protein
VFIIRLVALYGIKCYSGADQKPTVLAVMPRGLRYARHIKHEMGSHMTNDVEEKSKEQSTAGEVLADGTALELLRDPLDPKRTLLLHWNGEACDVGPRIAHGGREYVPVVLDAGLSTALRLPTGIGPEESPGKLFSDIFKLLSETLNQGKSSILKLTLAILASWVSDVLPISPLLWIVAPVASPGDITQQLLALLCRHSLVLAGVRYADLAGLPWPVHPTLIMDECEMRAPFIRLLRASSRRGTNMARRGRIVCPYGAKIILSTQLPGDLLSEGDALHIALTPSPGLASVWDEKMEKEIAEQFQPRLLGFRLRNRAKVLLPEFDVSQLTPPAQDLARALGATVIGEKVLERAILKLLTDEEEEYRMDRSRTIEAVVLEAILYFCHEQDQTKIRSAELAQQVNVILRGRGSSEEVSPETVGRTLKRLGIPRRRIGSAGNGSELTNSIRRTVHTAALSLCALGTLACPDCKYCEECRNPNPQVGFSGAASAGGL